MWDDGDYVDDSAFAGEGEDMDFDEACDDLEEEEWWEESERPDRADMPEERIHEFDTMDAFVLGSMVAGNAFEEARLRRRAKRNR